MYFFKLNYVKCTIYFMKYKLCWAQGQRAVFISAKDTDGVLGLYGPKGCLLGQNNHEALRVHQSASLL